MFRGLLSAGRPGSPMRWSHHGVVVGQFDSLIHGIGLANGRSGLLLADSAGDTRRRGRRTGHRRCRPAVWGEHRALQGQLRRAAPTTGRGRGHGGGPATCTVTVPPPLKDTRCAARLWDVVRDGQRRDLGGMGVAGAEHAPSASRVRRWSELSCPCVNRWYFR